MKRSNLLSVSGFYLQQKADFCQNHWRRGVDPLFFGEIFHPGIHVDFYADIYNPYKHYRTSRVPPWCCHTPPCHAMIHSRMVGGTWQIAQGSDLASELPRSQSNRAFTLEPAPRPHPSRPRGSPVNDLLTGSTEHTERSVSSPSAGSGFGGPGWRGEETFGRWFECGGSWSLGTTAADRGQSSTGTCEEQIT